MLLTLEKLGNWNPQLFRELKGRLTLRNIAFAAFISFASQFFLLLYFNVQLPVAPPIGEYNIPTYHQYCSITPVSSSQCLRDASGYFLIDWQDWWQDIFRVFNWILPFILVVAGAYMLIGDMVKEERRGTLNFIRLTPQSSQKILIGKMLGVPVLIYLATALAIPLHLLAASSAAVPFGFVLTFYVMLGAICGFLYSTTLFYALLGRAQAWLGAVGAVVLVYPFLQALNFFLSVVMSDSQLRNYLASDHIRWFYLPVGSNLAIAYCFSLLSICLGTYWIWQILNRRFRNPSATIASKSQSYLLVTCVNLWLVGFGVTELSSSSSSSNFGIIVAGLSLFLLLPFCFLILIAALSPHRQTLQDWARYCGEKKNNKTGRKKIFSAFLVALQDLMFDEKSPALVAIAINLAISAAIWIPWILLFPQNIVPRVENNKAILALLLSANLVLICAAIAQLILLMKTRKPQIGAAVAVSAVLILPGAIMVALGITFKNNPNWWLISAFPVFGIEKASTTAIFLTILGQWSVLALLSLQLNRQLRKAGDSASKAVLAARPSLTR